MTPTTAQSVMQAALQRVTDFGEDLLVEYVDKFGTVLNADHAAELFPEYAESNEARARYRIAVHPSAQWVRDELFKRALAIPSVKEIVFTIGGNGAGKTASRLAGDVVYDSTLNNRDHAIRMVEAALTARKSVQIVYFFRPIADAFLAVLERSHIEGRTVPIEALIRTHSGAAETAQALFESYGDHPQVGMQFIHNHRDETVLGDIELTRKEDYGGFSEQLHGILETERAKLPHYLYEITKGSTIGEQRGRPSKVAAIRAASVEEPEPAPYTGEVAEVPSSGAARAPELTPDAAARKRIRESLDESLIVEASAGTGKTTELVGRIVAILKAGKAEIGQIAAVTFTHKAAGELKLRLREALYKERQASPDHAATLERALGHLEEATIGTIHSFCAQLLRERPVEARVDPAFQELSEQESARLFQQSFRVWMERSLGESSPGLRRAFARLAWRDGWDDGPPMEQLQFAAKKLLDWRDYTAPWRREPFPREEELRTLLTKAREVADASSRPRRVTDNLYKGLQPARLMVQSLDRPEVADGQTDYDLLEAQILKLGRDLRRDVKKGSGDYGGGTTREDLCNSRDQLLVWIDDFRRRADADLAATLRAEMAPLIVEYNERKQRQGKLDFVDLLILARNLIVDQQPVRAYLQRRFSHLFIDEFQDTDPLQAEILLLLAADDPQENDWRNVTPVAGKLFLVGDPKQSIYKFRRADIALYRQIREDLQARGVGHVNLTRSFRSVPNIQGLVNAAFESEMTGDGHADYSALEPFRESNPGQPSVVVLPVPKPYRTRLSKDAVNQSLPDAIAAYIAWLVNESGWTHQPKAGAPAEPIRARDVAVLFRRRTQAGKDLTREYARALEARGVEHLLAGSKSFHHREEVETLRAALTAIEWPEDELSVFATLKGSLFAIPDEMLFFYKHRHGRLHPFHRPEPKSDSPAGGSDADVGELPANPEATVTSALAILAELHRARNHRPFAATVNALLEATRAHAAFLLRPGGNQILANVARVADLARTFEMTGGVSFRGFVEELSAQAEKGEASEAPVLEEDSDGVRLMTVHGAKGLEFPVVILADLTANLCARDPDQYVDGIQRLHATRLLRCAPWELLDHEADEAMRERAEGVRVAYVAATRARDLLVIPAIGDEAFPMDGWLSPLDKAVYPARDAFRRSEVAEGCPQFGSSSVMNRPAEYGSGPEPSVKPGLVRPQQGSHEVVWWDPYQLQLGDEANYGVRSEHLLKQDGGESLAAYQAWKEERATVIHRAANPTIDLFLASQAKDAPPAAATVEYIQVARVETEARPGGRRFGTLVHSVLRDASLDADGATVRRTAELNGRILGAPANEVSAAAQAIIAALVHPLMRDAASSDRLHREYPLRLALEGNRVLEGVIDLAYFTAGRWVIVDFKTDANLADRRASYERQLQWYAHAIGKLTGFPARAVLLGI